MTARILRFLRVQDPQIPFDEANWYQEISSTAQSPMSRWERKHFLFDLERKIEERSYYLDAHVPEGVWVSEYFVVRVGEGAQAARIRLSPWFLEILAGGTYRRFSSDWPLLASPTKQRLSRIFYMLKQHEGE